jgi:hypothetical protein
VGAGQELFQKIAADLACSTENESGLTWGRHGLEFN